MRAVRFYISPSPPRFLPLLVILLVLLYCDHLRPVFPAGPQPQSSAASVPCRTSTATIGGWRSLPDLSRDHPWPVSLSDQPPKAFDKNFQIQLPVQEVPSLLHCRCDLSQKGGKKADEGAKKSSRREFMICLMAQIGLTNLG